MEREVAGSQAGAKRHPNAFLSTAVGRWPEALKCTPFLLCPQGGWVLLEKSKGNWGKSLDPWAHAAHSLLQMYQVTFCSSGTKTFLAFLIMGWGFRSSSANLCFRGLKSSPPGTLDKTRSAGSGLKFTSTSTQLGSMGLGVSLSFSKEDSERERGRWSWKSLDSLNSQGSRHTPRHLLESQGHTNYCCLEGRKTIRAPAPHKPDWHMWFNSTTQTWKEFFPLGTKCSKGNRGLRKRHDFPIVFPPRNVKQNIKWLYPLNFLWFQVLK